MWLYSSKWFDSARLQQLQKNRSMGCSPVGVAEVAQLPVVVPFCMMHLKFWCGMNHELQELHMEALPENQCFAVLNAPRTVGERSFQWHGCKSDVGFGSQTHSGHLNWNWWHTSHVCPCVVEFCAFCMHFVYWFDQHFPSSHHYAKPQGLANRWHWVCVMTHLQCVFFHLLQGFQLLEVYDWIQASAGSDLPV